VSHLKQSNLTGRRREINFSCNRPVHLMRSPICAHIHNWEILSIAIIAMLAFSFSVSRFHLLTRFVGSSCVWVCNIVGCEP
jgi:hypothetical protein